MLDVAFRFGFVVIGGLVLALALLWYSRIAYHLVTGRGEVVIDPFEVVDGAGKEDGNIGKALAGMLQTRLESLAMELREAQSALSASSTSRAPGVERVGDVRLWTQDVTLNTRLLEPIEMKVAVGGVEVGGALPWLQRQLSGQRTLHFTIFSTGDETQIVGTVSPLGLSGPGVRLIVKGTGGTPPSLDVVIDHLTHELIRRSLIKDRSNRVELLRAPEFMTLSSAVVTAADLNRRSLLGRPVQKEFMELIPQVTPLCELAPDWTDLNYFVAWIADKARDTPTATNYYNRVLAQTDAAKQGQLVTLIQGRLAALKASSPLATADEEKVSDSAEKSALDYSEDVKVRDSGPEGSVVGLALASTLEILIHRSAHKEVKISPRYLYYIAREVGGNTSEDVGATLKDAIGALASKGAVEESVWPYVPGHYAEKPPTAVQTARRIWISDVKHLTGKAGYKRSLAKNGPVLVGLTMYESAMSPKVAGTGVLPLPKEKEQVIGGHAVVLVGYDDTRQSFKFLNSWGTGWGDKGFGYLSYDYVAKYVSEGWTFRLRSPDASEARTSN